MNTSTTKPVAERSPESTVGIDAASRADGQRSGTPKDHRPKKPIGGWLLLALPCVAAFAIGTAVDMRDPLKLMLEWELLDVFLWPGPHGWYRTVIALTACDVATGALIVVGAGWLLLLAASRSARFPRHAEVWLLTVVAARAFTWGFGEYLTHAIGVAIAIPLDSLGQAITVAGLGIPYLRRSMRVRATFRDAPAALPEPGPQSISAPSGS